MQARLVRLKGSPDGAGERLARFENEAVPAMRGQAGFGSVLALGNAEGAEAVISYWDSEEALVASREPLAALDRMAPGLGLEVLSVDEYEVALMEQKPGTGPEPGNAGRVTRARNIGDAIDKVLAEVREEWLPLVQSLPGWKSTTVGVNRSAGRLYKVTWWETPADHDASEAARAGHHAMVEQRFGASERESERYEITFADVPSRVRS